MNSNRILKIIMAAACVLLAIIFLWGTAIDQKKIVVPVTKHKTVYIAK